MSPSGILAVLRFEMRRMMTLPRLAGWVALTLICPLLAMLLKFREVPMTSIPQAGIFLLVLIPFVTCCLHLLLWATPVITSEMESRALAYISVRPTGRISMFLGKYIAAAVRASVSGALSLGISLLIMQPDGIDNLFVVLFILVLMASFSYGALYALIGVLFPSRAMPIALAYTLTVELLVSFIPALINQITLQFRLRYLFADWIGHSVWKQDFEVWMGNDPAWQHVAILVGYTIGLLALGMWVIHRREYVKAEQEIGAP